MTSIDTAVTHCIFDMDGLLLDTERIYTEVTQDILDKYVPGEKFKWELKSKLMGRTALESANMIIEALKIPMSVEDYLEETAELQSKKWPECEVLPGVERLIKHLKSNSIPIAVATSSTHPKFLLKTSRHRDLFALFDSITCGDDPLVRNGKPSPDIFLVAKEKLGASDAARCLVFEDAVNGIEAATAAGMRCVWVPDHNMKKVFEGQGDMGAACVVTSMADFKPELFGLPAF
ncbi:Pseudouridine-5'-phosphatase [Thoreauomyces humboldtii]|nr:Pseudouridine-5'-phosphatase [Thoreauomyces humboldtii]